MAPGQIGGKARLVVKSALGYTLQFALSLGAIQPEGYWASIPLQHLLVGGLAGIGKLFGYRALYSEHASV